MSHISSGLSGGTCSRDDLVDDFGADRAHRVADVLGVHELRALLVDDLALVVRDVVELEQLLADVEVMRLDLALRALDLPRQQLLSITSPSFMPAMRSSRLMRSGSPKIRIRLSSSDR